jgi:hypothetical protein
VRARFASDVSFSGFERHHLFDGVEFER